MAPHNALGYRTDVRRDPKNRKLFMWTLSKVDEVQTEHGVGYTKLSVARKDLRAAITAYLKRKKTPQIRPISLYE